MNPHQQLTNTTGVPLSIAVWLSSDDYDHIDDPNYINVTTLIKSPRQIILGRRATPTYTDTPDVASMMNSKFGSAVHQSIEATWLNNYRQCLRRLGYPEKVIDRIRINPPETPELGIIPIYMEKRAFRKIGKLTLGGKYDFVGDGHLDDFKTTGVFTYMSGSNEWKYKLQGSLYRWLNPEIITGDHMNIQFIFTDWSRRDAMIKAKDGYPPTKIFQHKIKLNSVPETDVWVKERVRLIESLEDTPEAELPYCEARDLWQDAPTFKYYKNPAKKTRSTANFQTSAEATIRWIKDGRVGQIEEIPGATKGCLYCDAFQQCTQKDALIACGSLRV